MKKLLLSCLVFALSLVSFSQVNNNPLVDNPIADQIYDEGFGSDIIDLATVFSDPDGDNLSLSVVSSNTGVVNVGIVGTILTITEVGLGSATVTVTATDDGVPILAVDDPFLVTVNNVNDNPLVDNPIADQIYDEGFGSDIIDLATVFSDPDGDNLSLSVVSSNTGVVNVGIVGTILTITEVGLGSATVTVTATDDGVPILAVDDPFLVTVNNVNDNPLVDNPIDDQVFDEGFSSFVIDLDTVFSDPDISDILSFSAISSNTAAVTVDVATNILTISEAGLGTSTITVTATDNGVGNLTVDDVFTVTVNNVNDFPLVDNPIDDQVFDEGFSSFVIDLDTVFSDPDISDILSFSAISSNTAAVTVDVATNILTISEAGLGTSTITVTATDNGVGNLTVDDVFTVTVNNVNDFPLVDNPIDDQVFDEGFSSFVIDLDTVFSDPDISDILSFSAISSNTAAVTVDVATNILTISEAGLETSTITVTATDNGVGNLTVDDVFTVTVNNVNDFPLVDNPIDDQVFDEGFSSFVIDLDTVFSDPDISDILSFSAISSNTAAVTVDVATNILTISEAGLGTSTITVTATDNGVGNLTVDDVFTVTVNNVNDFPLVDNPIDDQVFDEGFSSFVIDLDTVFSDPDISDILSFSAISSNTAAVTVDVATNILTISEAGLGTSTITVTATDNGVGNLTVDDVFTVTVNNVNDFPLVDNPIDDQVFDEGFSSFVIDLDTVFSDPDISDILSFSAISSNTAAVTVDVATNILTISEAGLGTSTITVTATDNGVGNLTVDDVFTVTVNNVNDFPLVDNPIDDQVFDEGFSSFVIDLDTVFSDPDISDILSFSAISSNTAAVTVDVATNILTISEAGLGTSTITVTATDNGVGNLTVDDVFTVTVNNVNDFPLVDNPIDDQVFDEGFSSFVIDLDTVFSDPDISDILSFSAISSNTAAVTVDVATNILTISEAGLGTSTITVTATDNGVGNLTVDDVFTVTVNNVNDFPLVDNPIDDQVFDEGFSSFVIDLDTVFSDPDISDILSFSAISSNTAAVTVDVATNILTISEAGLGTSTITVTATDNGVGNLTVDDVFTVTVNNVNDFPLVDNPIDDQVFDEGFSSFVIDLDTVFSDPDISDILSFSAISSNTAAVTVDVATNILTISEAGLGTSTITVTATDNGVGNLTVDDVFTVTVNNVNDFPLVDNPIDDQVFDEGFSSFVIDLDTVFSDPDISDILSFSAISSNTAAVTVDVATNILTISEAGLGTSTITVTATDNGVGNLTVDDVFTVTVNNVNDFPLVDNPIDDQVFDEGFSSFVIDLDTVFSDPDISDILSFSAISSNTAAVTVDVATNILTISEAGLGTSTITVTATDNGVGNLTVDDVFTVTVNNVNDFPLVDNPIDDQVFDEGFSSFVIDLDTVFSDPDISDILSFSAISSNTAAVTVDVATNILTISEAGLGTSTITVTATDNGVGNLTVDDVFTVTVNNAFYDINISANPSEGGSISGGGTYSIGATVNLLATPSSGYNFVDWTDDSDNSYVSDLADYSFSAIEDISLTANFEANQSITLSTGWNIMSSNIIPDDPSMANVFSTLISSGFLEKVQDETGDAVEYVEPIGWVYEIAEIQPTEGYKIRVNTDTQLDISGSFVSSPLSIALIPGWNIMGFPDRTPQVAIDIVNDLIIAGQLNKVQNETGNAIVYIDGIGWIDNIINFFPGEGYKINVSEASSINYATLPKSYISIKENSYYVHFKPSWSGNGYDHMNVYILPDKGLEPGDEVALFDEDKCVGIGKMQEGDLYISIAATMDDPITSWQDGFRNGNIIKLKVWDESDEKEYTVEEIQFYNHNRRHFEGMETTVINLNLLDIINNESLAIKTASELGYAYPNPFNSQTTIPYSLNDNSNVRIEIYDRSGRKIKVLIDQQKVTGNHFILWDGTDQSNKQVPVGLYYYKLITNDFVQVKTIVFSD